MRLTSSPIDETLIVEDDREDRKSFFLSNELLLSICVDCAFLYYNVINSIIIKLKHLIIGLREQG
jgi:hypothetical protein